MTAPKENNPGLDQLAAMAMQGLLANSNERPIRGEPMAQALTELAFAAYEIAEAMLAERSRRHEHTDFSVLDGPGTEK